MPISGLHIPGIPPGMAALETGGGATGARTGCGAVNGGAVSTGRATGGSGCAGGCEGADE